MPGTPGHPIVTQEWQFLIVLAVGIAAVFVIHRIVRRLVAREKSRDRHD